MKMSYTVESNLMLCLDTNNILEIMLTKAKMIAHIYSCANTNFRLYSSNIINTPDRHEVIDEKKEQI